MTKKPKNEVKYSWYDRRFIDQDGPASVALEAVMMLAMVGFFLGLMGFSQVMRVVDRFRR